MDKRNRKGLPAVGQSFFVMVGGKIWVYVRYKDTRYKIQDIRKPLRRLAFLILYLVSAELARRVSCIYSISPNLNPLPKPIHSTRTRTVKVRVSPAGRTEQ